MYVHDIVVAIALTGLNAVAVSLPRCLRQAPWKKTVLTYCCIEATRDTSRVMAAWITSIALVIISSARSARHHQLVNIMKSKHLQLIVIGLDLIGRSARAALWPEGAAPAHVERELVEGKRLSWHRRVSTTRSSVHIIVRRLCGVCGEPCCAYKIIRPQRKLGKPKDRRCTSVGIAASPQIAGRRGL
jgi:hypothetical protein